jgi:tRNA-splicing ligase RtcB
MMKVFNKEDFTEVWQNAVNILCWANEVEAGAYLQATHLAQLPFIFSHVALMPDVHEGYGMPIGGVVACLNAVIPNAVGVDIGCGMCAVRTNRSIYDWPQSEMPELLEKIRHSIKRDIPVGFGIHRDPQEWDGFNDLRIIADGYREDDRYWLNKKNFGRAIHSLGTLGGGNHFIEIQRSADSNGIIWLMLHSGSRNLGKVIADFYHKEALAMCEKWHSKLPHKDLAYLPADDELGQAYIRDMNLALAFAQENRRRMMEVVKRQFKYYAGEDTEFVEEINIHHNYANLENHMGRNVWVHRKGATSAKGGQFGIIPGSMGTPSYIVIGRGNSLSFTSCSHGAGRKMGRMDASRNLKEGDCWAAMGDVLFDGWGRIGRGKMKGKLDLGEAPGAYKDIDEVIESQRDLIDVHARLLPLAVIKG